MTQNKSKYITLKEAAEISGYAPDYIGQLIRKGKLPGKQVYYNVAWMTTEEDLKHYMAKANSAKQKLSWSEDILERVRAYKARMLLEAQMTRFLKIFFYLAIVFCVAFCLLLFYVLSVNLDKSIGQKSEKSVQTNQIQNINSSSPVSF